MKVAAIVARVLLGLAFLVFGLNAFFHFIPGSNMVPPGLAGQFVTAMNESHYMYAIATFQVLGGALMLSGVAIPLGLVFLGPILVNILCFHIFLAHAGFQPGVVCTILWFIVFVRYRNNFSGLFHN